MLVAPFDLHNRLISLIERERDHAAAGKPARIVAKLNSLVDQGVIEKLYEASCAGVKIDLYRPRYLLPAAQDSGLERKHSRDQHRGAFSRDTAGFIILATAAKPDLYLASADWMPRNFYRRVEIAFPIESPAVRDEIINEVLPRFLTDYGKARELQPDGSYVRLKPEEGAPRSQAQLQFREHSRRQAKKLAEKQACRQNALVADQESA